MKNQLVSIDSRDNLLELIPLGYIRKSLEKGFRKNVYSPDDKIGAVEVYEALKYLESKVTNIRHGMFQHYLDLKVDKLNDYIYWKYIIKIRNATISILVSKDTFDSFEVDTPAEFMKKFGQKMNKANARIRALNESARSSKPTIPANLPKYELLNGFMNNTRGTVSIDIANAVQNLKRLKLNKSGSAALDFKTFTMPDTSWFSIDVVLNLGDMMFLLVEKEMSYNNQIELEGFYKGLIDEMEAALRNWNFIVEGRKKSQVRTREGARYMITGDKR